MKRFLQQCAALGFDVERIRRVALATLAYYGGSATTRQQLRDAQELERRWYESLRRGEPDYGVYTGELYLPDAWACWVVYSRPYLRSISSKQSLSPGGVVADLGVVRRVVDLGCGLGYTTAALAQMFPAADVYGTNLPDTRQYELATRIGRGCHFSLVPTEQQIEGPADLVFASEYFEHFEAPIDRLLSVVKRLHPRALIVANSFVPQSVGHFNEYRVDGEIVPRTQLSKRFNATLTQLGFRRVKLKVWNGRPAYWKHVA
jgi:SAM-dependent methyltransferase